MPSDKEITIYDIAKELNISPATVSRGLKDHPGIRKDTKRKILEAARKMGYQQNTFASNLRSKRSNTIGVIIPRLNSYFMATVIAGMEKVANQRGYNLIISQTQESFKKEIASVNTMFNSRIDGLMVSLAYDTDDTKHFDLLLKRKIPIIFFDRVLTHPGCTSIVIDNRQAGFDATHHLIQQGCSRIVHIAGNLSRNVYSDRLEGYKQALVAAGIPFDPALVINNSLSEQGGMEAAQQILAMPQRPDGIFSSNDTSAVACISQLKASGIQIPQQMAVVGFNNDPISKVIEPNLSTVHYPGHEMGEVAASTLITKLDQPAAHALNTIVLRHELIVRASSIRK
ncbi:MAG: LacI family DNA-binding transcriptional regulator [Cyclobacteriaceae bacterium]|nr:LacI family DNA-binding transcriptional regulator [Cyclobacteriaceae bacterium]